MPFSGPKGTPCNETRRPGRLTLYRPDCGLRANLAAVRSQSDCWGLAPLRALVRPRQAATVFRVHVSIPISV
jgi:hypothetical protein